MRLWQEKKGTEATYLCLAEGLECLKLRDTIIYLLDLYSASKQEDKNRIDKCKEPDVPKLGNHLLVLTLA